MSAIWGFNHIEDKHSLYRRKDCVKKLCESLREGAKSIIDFDMKKNFTVNKKRIKNICGIRFLKSLSKI